METSVFVAKLVAVCYLAMGLGMLLNPAYYRKVMDDVLKSSVVAMYGGMVALAVGFVLVSIHNVWVQDWTVLITILGWLALVKGVLLIVLPGPFLNFSRAFVKNLRFVTACALIFGLVLGYFGFFV